MNVDCALRVILVALLGVAVVGCGEQSNNPLLEEAEERTETIPLIFESPENPELEKRWDRNDPYVNFRFRVEIDGILQAGFYEVILPDSWFSIGQKGEVYTQHNNLILKWGITENMELYSWFRSASKGKIDRRNLSVILQDEEGNDGPRWNFTQAWPIRYDAPDLDALGNFVAIETLEIAFEEMERVS